MTACDAHHKRVKYLARSSYLTRKHSGSEVQSQISVSDFLSRSQPRFNPAFNLFYTLGRNSRYILEAEEMWHCQ